MGLVGYLYSGLQIKGGRVLISGLENKRRNTDR